MANDLFIREIAREYLVASLDIASVCLLGTNLKLLPVIYENALLVVQHRPFEPYEMLSHFMIVQLALDTGLWRPIWLILASMRIRKFRIKATQLLETRDEYIINTFLLFFSSILFYFNTSHVRGAALMVIWIVQFSMLRDHCRGAAIERCRMLHA